MITIKQIKAKIHKWKQRSNQRKRRHEFNKLSSIGKLLVMWHGNDPDTLEAKEREENGDAS